jgi:pimeloyl-ACP methyl ester carboxylesterase
MPALPEESTVHARLFLPVVACVAFASGCQIPKALTAPSEEEQVEIERKREIPTEVRCYALEFDHEAKERPRPRQEPYDRVEFNYTSSRELRQTMGAQAPTHVFVMVHGWMNNAISSQQFSSRWVNGIRGRAQAGEKLAFVSLHWDSERLVFHESAMTATKLGKRRIAPLLQAIRQAAPQTRITVIGHSLGARAMISALHNSAERYTDSALLVEGAADADWLHDDMSKAGERVSRVANVYSIHDGVLENAYANAMQAKALGRIGAERAPGVPFARFELSASFAGAEFQAALSAETSVSAGGSRVVNVDASSVVTGHTDIDKESLYDLAWAITR